MTRLDADEAVTTAVGQAQEPASGGDGPRALLLEAREVPLGGVRAMSVRRALPQRDQRALRHHEAWKGISEHDRSGTLNHEKRGSTKWRSGM